MGTRTGLLVAAITLAGCAPAEMSVFVGNNHFLEVVPANAATCTGQAEALISGFLNILGSTTPSYLAQFDLKSDLQEIDTQVGADLLATGNRNDFLVDTMITSYSVFNVGAGGLPQNQRSPLFFVVPPNSAEGHIRLDLLSTQAAAALVTTVPFGSATTPDVLINLQFEGRLRSQPDSPLTRFKTNAVVFPVTVVNTAVTAPACVAPQVAMLHGPCGNSQESFTFKCVTP